ncbi:MAG: transposase [Myxococcota bacterium]|nr:transposase [Myxococcota bacterium]
MAESKRRNYTAEQRAIVVADVPILGICAAAKKHQVPKTCVSRWAAAEGVKREPEKPGKSEKPGESEKPPAPAAQRPEAAQSEPSAEAAAAPATSSLSRVAKSYTPSQKARALEDVAQDGVSKTARKHGISRFSLYEWKRRLALIANEWSGAKRDRATAGRGDSQRVAQSPRSWSKPDRQPACSQEHQSLGAYRSARHGGCWLSAPKSREAKARAALPGHPAQPLVAHGLCTALHRLELDLHLDLD